MILRDILNLSSHIKEHLELGIQLKDSRIFNRFVIQGNQRTFYFGLGINLLLIVLLGTKILVLNQKNNFK